MSTRWYDGSINPKYSFRHTYGFLTDGCGHAFKLHKGTKYDQIESLVHYLDQLETEIERLKERER